ncbi:MAG TPA: tape measure protein [Methylibium sp.]|nr:tape measure protein [Methylibium sp.]
MANNDLEVRIGANLAEIRTALASLRGEVAAVGQAAQKSGGSGAFQGIGRGASGALTLVKQLVGALVAAAGGAKLIAAADEFKSLNARLKLVTGSTEEYADAQVKLFDLAQRTRSSLGETINLYARIANATKDAGVGQDTLLQVVETVNQAVQLSGASAQAAEAALIQLGQGLASGALRGEELNSVLEQTPALADAIAKGLGVTRGELRKLGQDGKLSAEQVLTALRNQREEVAQQFAQLPLTVGQSVTLLKNAGLQLVGAFDTVSGATGGLSGVIKDLAEFIGSDAVIGAVTAFAKTWSDAFAQLVADAREALRIIEDATGDIVGTGENAVQLIVRAFTELPRNLRSVVRIVTTLFAGLVDVIVANATLAKEAIAAIFTDDTIEAAIERRNRRVQAAFQTVRDLIDEEVAANRQAAADAKAAGAAAVAARQASRTRIGNTSTGSFRSQPSDASRRQAESLRKAELDAQEKLADDSAKRQLSILEQLYEDSRIATAEYFQRREEIELQALDRAIAIERQRLSVGGAEAVKARTQIELLEREKGDIQAKALRERAAAERALDRETEQLRAQALEQSGQVAAAAQIRLEAQFRDLIARLQASGNTEGVKLIRGLIDAGVAQAQFDQIKAQFDRTVADLQARQQQVADQRNAGALTPAIADQQVSQARQQAQAELERLNQQLQALAANTTNPEIKRGAEEATQALRRMAVDGATGLDKALIDLRASLAAMREGFAQTATSTGVDALTGLFTDLASGTKDAGDAFKDFVRSFVLGMAQVAARALATFLVLSLLDAVFPGAGKMVAAVGGATASVQHSGGMAGTGPRRKVDPMLFFGAPRYHAGGLVGLKPDERPAILQTGEEVLSRVDPRNAANGGGAGGAGTRIINVIDPNLVGDYLTSASGERTILNVIERNAGAIRQKLG